jgi:four helix bundle protein
MAVRRYQDLIAWQTADAFKSCVFQIVMRSAEARNDHRFRSQILESARSVPANIAEGFRRFSPREFARFLDYSLGSLAEAECRLADGTELGYFSAVECEEAFKLARRCLTASVRLKRSQQRFLK